MKPKKPTGRPSIRDEAVVAEILKRIAGGETLSAICREEGKPDRTVFYDWLNDDAELSQRFARAREVGFDAIADETLTIVDDRDEDPASRRVRSDTRLKLLAKWSPRRYGDRLELAGDPERPLAGASDEQVEARIAELLSRRSP